MKRSDRQQKDERALPRAAIYLRVSTKEQAEMGGKAEGFSIPAQREACLRKAESLGAFVIAEFRDLGESARTADRPGLQELLRFVNEEVVDYVLVHKVDRLARNRFDDVQINFALKQAGVTLVSVAENIDETPSGLLLHGIMSSIAEYHSRNLATEVIKGSVQKAQMGGTVGIAPLGYSNVRQIVNGREIRTVEIDEERAPLVRWAFEQYAGGEWSLQALVDELNRRGLTNRPGPNRPARPLVKSHLASLLAKRYYVGFVSYRGIEYRGSHEPLIEDDTFARVQAVLAERAARNGTKTRVHRHHLKGLIFCGSCEARLSIMMSKNRHGTVYPYFFCLGKQHHRTGCKQSVLRIEQVEEAIAQHYKKIQLTAVLREDIRKHVEAEITRRRRQVQAEAKKQGSRMSRLHNERTKLLHAHYNDAVPLDLMRQEQARIEKEMEQAKRLLAGTDLRLESIQADLQKALDLLEDCQATYRGSPDHVKRLFNQAFFEKLLIDEEYVVTAPLAEPFRSLVEGEFAMRRARRRERPGTPERPYERALAAIGDRWGSDNLPEQGSRTFTLVGATGLEPVTSAVSRQRSAS